MDMRLLTSILCGLFFVLSTQAADLERADVDKLAGQPVEGKSLRWKRLDVCIEWGFQPGTENADFSGRIEASHRGKIGRAIPLDGDTITKMTGAYQWESTAASKTRRGIIVPLLYTNARPGPEQTAITVRTKAGSFTFLPADAQTGPILVPEHGFFIRALNTEPTATPVASGEVAPPLDLLKEKIDAISGGRGLRGWGSNATPWVGANPRTEDLSASTFKIPPRSVAMHPGQSQNVAAGWRSPVRGRVEITANLASGDMKGGDGIEWWITLDARNGSRTLDSGTKDHGVAMGMGVVTVTVEPGDLISLTLGPRGNHVCDTTIARFTVAHPESSRKWDLTKDVVDNIQAGNPHADSLGNPAVWHFYLAETPSTQPPAVAENWKATTARDFVAELAARKLKTIRQRVREHPEQSWEQAVRAMFPKDKDSAAPKSVLDGGKPMFFETLPPYPTPAMEPSMKVEVPDPWMTAAWRSGAWHILRVCKKDAKGRWIIACYPYPPLAQETHLILRALDLMGMHSDVRQGMDLWLEHPRADGCLNITGTIDAEHFWGPGTIQWAIAEHYALTGDKDWLAQVAPKLKANADWMIAERKKTMRVKGDKRMRGYGLQPPRPIGDMGHRDRYYPTDGYYWLGLQRSGEVLSEIDPEAGRKILDEAKAYREDLLAAINESIILSPVLKIRDGTYRSFIPVSPDIRGTATRTAVQKDKPLDEAGDEFYIRGGPGFFGHGGPFWADTDQNALPLVEPDGLLSPLDKRVQGHLDLMEDLFLLTNAKLRERTKNYDPEKHWFSHAGWYYQCGYLRTANIYLLQDDVPNFLRSMFNQMAVDLVPGPWVFKEHTTLHPAMDKSFEEAGFLERFRMMLVMEEGDTLWLARATPRAWLEQDKKIRVSDAPTRFGPVTYEITSDTDHSKISATIDLPSRKPPKTILLRLRHPRSLPIKSVLVNGKPWPQFNAEKELITLENLAGKLAITANY